MHLARDLCLLGQFVEHIVLRPSQDKRRDDATQHTLRSFVVELLDRRNKAVRELLERAEQIRIGKLHEVPDLTEVVLHRRTGEQDAEGAF